MNKVSIHINELGPVKNQSIELKPVMLFTGESGLGKSYVNFLTYYLFYVFSSDRMNEFLLEKIDVDFNDKKEFQVIVNTTELVDWLQRDVRSFFVYLFNFDDIKCDVRFVFERVEDVYNFKIKILQGSKEYREFSTFEVFLNGSKVSNYFYFSQRLDVDTCDVIRRILCNRFFGDSVSRSFLLPPGRASLLTGDYTAQSGSSKLGLYDLFLRDNDFINSMVLRNKQKNIRNVIFKSQIHDLIKGDLTSEKDGVFLLTEDKQKIPLGAAASSVKELTPLLQLILSEMITNHAICIEEPEAHLHSEMQISIADLLALCVNRKASLQITTHSDYFLQRINQLIKYGCLKNKDDKRYMKLCEETGHLPDCYLNKDDLNAYYFSSENGLTKIELLNIGNEGVPLSTFFNAVGILSKEDELLNDELEKLKKLQ